jgi:hypothetical protein
MSTITPNQQDAIRAYLDTHTLPKGLGTAESACSIAAINLALSGELTDTIPDCMSEVIGKWIIGVQDEMPDEMRNSAEWKSLLPLAAGTGRERERERVGLILDWMWGTVLPTVQPVADAGGFGVAWQRMTTERTDAAARTAAYAANAAAYAYAANAAANAANAAANAANAAAARTAARTAAAYTAASAYAAYTAAAAWQTFNPAGLLAQLIEVKP